ncbi:MAG: amino acid adenylation domain-containing protein, partial [Prevotella sp.]|nr:amino acid adenylation domain-containing protein [Prevotella sp.]
MRTNEYLQPLWDAFERFADLPAVVDNGGRITTYRQLGELTRRIAGGLASLDLPENSFIPILLPTSMEYIAAELGVWMAGHAIVPMGTTFPEGRIEYIKEHCEAPLIIDAQRLKAFSEVDELRDEVTRFELEQKALLIYTSGSTGEPKGILHCFDSLCSHVHTGSLQEEHTDMVWGTSSPFYFVAAMSNFPVLKGGGQLHFYTGDVLFDVRKLEDYIEEHGVTHTFISPAVLANFHNRSKSLKVVFTGSEKLVNQCSRDGYLLYNNYGMTETLGTLLHFKVDKPYESTPVGVPNKEEIQELMLVGDDGKPVAEGEEGELVVKGCFCKGYYKDPERTAQLYQDGWLHTNDILRRLPDGNFVYVNRKDWMVKINGQRVEPGEVEQAIQRIDGVTKAIVKGFDGKTGSQYLCGYYTSVGDITPEVIRNTLAERLPPYMVPLHIVKVDEFSFLPNGKVNRKALLPPDSSELLSNYVAPTNEVERTLCEAFAQALGMEQVGIDDDFFMLGGDSIKVMRLQQQCESLSLTSKMIYKGKTPRHIAELCDVVTGDIAAPEFPVALSQTQMGIYAESMARQGEAAYNNPILLKIGAEIDEQKLAQAIEQVVSAHAFIKTRIEEDAEGNPVMVPSDAAYKQTIEQMSEAELEVLKPQLIQPFNLQKDQLFRIRIIRTEAGLYLFSDFHHIIYDGTSMRIFMADVDRAYAGETIAPEQWTGWHVAQEETALRQTEAYTEAKAWYEENFSGLDIENKPIPDVLGEKTVTFGSQDLLLGISNEAINVFCRRQGVTANILAIAAFAKLMGAYTNQEAALFTTIYNGRNSLRTARTIDMMVKTLPVYSRWTADTRIKDFLHDVKQQLLGAMNNDIYSFAEVAANLGVSSDVLFAYQGDYLTLGTVCGQPYNVIPLEKNATGSPLDVQIFNTADGPSLHVEFQKNMYSDALISELMQCYANVLRSMLTVERLSDIELLNADQLQELDDFNDTDVPYDDTQTVVSLFRHQAKATPDAEAVVFKDKRYTYREVDEISDRIAGYIALKGLGLEDAVSVIIPRCEWMVIASLGVLKAGCAYQPLDPTYPKERLNFMVKDADAKLLIADEALRDLVDEYQGEVLLTKDIVELAAVTQQPTEPKPENRFILLYTSGSTGVPKGCQLTHGNLVCYCHWYWKYYGLKPEHNVAEYASYGFDAHMDGIYPPLTAGATVHIVPEELRLDLIALNEYFETNHITHAFMTTQVAYQFATSIENHSLLHLSCGGEKLASLNPPASYQLSNGYGPTETTIFITIFPVHEKLVDIPIGKVLDNMRLYITDLQGHRLPVGAIGELWVAGPQVSRGYLNRPEKNAEVFITNPFTHEKKYAPAYRTGDIVRYLPDGNIQFVGRRDGQVKIRGFRIELKEVEAVIREFPGIKDATVQAFDAESGGKFIAAYIVSDEQINIEAMNNFILEQKPPYMVPAVTMQIDAIPLNQNQKVNRRALPKPEFKKMEVEESGNRPLNVLEQELMEMAAAVIGNKEFGVTTPLIYAGLTSILSIKFSVQIYKRFGIEIKSNQLTGGASIEAIENVILDQWMNGSEKGEVNSEKFVEDEGLKASPLTFAQTGVYFECVKNPLNVTYSMPSLYRFDKNVVSAELLEKVLAEFISIHPALSTHFDMTEEGVMQIPNEDQNAVIEQLTMTPSEFEEYKQQFLQPFRLSSGPLYRLVIITVEDEVYLLADFHHLVMDGDSMNTFTIQLGEALRGEKLEAETLSYAKFAVDEKRFEASEGFEANKTYFAEMLAEYESASEI